MPIYEYRCRVCDTRFEARREMAAAAEPAPCPEGHTDTKRLLSAVAVVGRTKPGPAPAPAAWGGGGGCGGHCACHPG